MAHAHAWHAAHGHYHALPAILAVISRSLPPIPSPGPLHGHRNHFIMTAIHLPSPSSRYHFVTRRRSCSCRRRHRDDDDYRYRYFDRH